MQINFLPIILMSVENFVEKARFYMLSASQRRVLASADIQENWGLIPSNRASVSRYTKKIKLCQQMYKKRVSCNSDTLVFEDLNFRLWEKSKIFWLPRRPTSEWCSGYSQHTLLRHTPWLCCMSRMPGRCLVRCRAVSNGYTPPAVSMS